MNRKKVIELINVAVNSLILIIITLYFILPYSWVLTAAFRENPGLELEFKGFTLENFVKLFHRSDVPLWFRNSLIVALSVVALVIILSFPPAYLMARYEFRGKHAILLLFILGMSVPISVIMIPIYSFARVLRLTNSLFGLSLFLAFRSLPMAIWLLKEFIKGIPLELEEAAFVDGAGLLRTMMIVTLPLTAPGLAVIGLMAFASSWGDFVMNLILITRDDLRTIALGIYYASLEATGWGYATINYGLLSAIAIIYVIPTFVLYILMQKYLVKGMVIGAVKM